MYYNNQHLVDDVIYAYLIVDGKTHEILAGNHLARSYYGDENGFQPLHQSFQAQENDNYSGNLLRSMEGESSYLMENVPSTKITGEEFVCDLEVCVVEGDPTLLFIVLKDKKVDSNLRVRDLVELDLSANAVFVVNFDQELSLVFGNSRFFQYTRLDTEEDATKKAFSFSSLVQEKQQDQFRKLLEYQLGQGNQCSIDIEFSFEEEYLQLYRIHAYKYEDEKGHTRLYGVLISIKKQSELMKKIEYDQQYFDIMQEFSKDLLFRIDVKKKTLVHRGDISKFVGLASEVHNYPESIRETRLIHPEDLEGYIAFAYKMMHGMPAVFEPRLQFNSGTFERYRLQGKPLFNQDGKTVQVVGKCENIQKYVEIEAKANYDPLTTTLNKHSFRELVEDNLSRAVEKDRFALLFMDFDNFKAVNDTMGHAFGDFLLEVTGKRILHCVRSHDRVGRVGGDEFVIFFHHVPSEEAVLERAEAILASLRREFNNGEERYSIRASIGIALFPDHGCTYEGLYHRADKALYRSKARGKDVATVYSDDLS